jgi:hypothetical protein
MEFLQWIESTSFSVWLRESPSIWAYPTLLFVHTVGLSFSAGPSVAMDLRLLGFARRVPIAPLEGFFRVIWIGFLVNAVSGALLLAANATTKLTNPVFYLKMTFVLIAMAVMAVMRRQVFRDSGLVNKPIDGAGRLLAIASIVCWFGAITAGRFMTYSGSSGAP